MLHLSRMNDISSPGIELQERDILVLRGVI